MPISSSGASTARNRTIRITNTISSAIGTISSVSRVAASRPSSWIAVCPPTSTSSPPASRAADRIGSIESSASLE